VREGKLKLFIHPLYFLLGAALITIGRGYDFVAYTVTIVVHEMGHAAAAERLGYVMDDIRIMPYGAAVGGALEGLKPKDELIIAIAGPTVNLILAVLFTALWWVFPATYFFTEATVYANLVTAICNLLPVYPLDGGRMLSAFLRLKNPQMKAAKILRVIGVITSAVLFCLAAVSIYFGFNVTLCIMAAFIFFSAMFDYRSDGYARVYGRTFRAKQIKRGLETKEIIISSETPLISALKIITPGYYYKFVIVDKNLAPVAILTESELEEAAAEAGAGISVGKCIKKCGVWKVESGV